LYAYGTDSQHLAQKLCLPTANDAAADDDDDDDEKEKEENEDDQGFANSECQVALKTKFCTVAPDICRSSVWKLLDVTLLVPTNLRCFSFGKFVHT
jgi:hypothetical protein